MIRRGTPPPLSFPFDGTIFPVWCTYISSSVDVYLQLGGSIYPAKQLYLREKEAVTS